MILVYRTDRASPPPRRVVRFLTLFAIVLIAGLGEAIRAHPTLAGEILFAATGILLFLLLRAHDLRS
jgi:hypothetical protein